jgi:HAD superfamily hydrolase (TIGR01509 family)
VALLQFGDVPFDADLVAFDKDGTLVDFELFWGRLATAWVEHLVSQTGDKELRGELCRSLGYDSQQKRTKPQSPLASASTDQLQAIAAATLYRRGIPWPESVDRARRAFAHRTDLPLDDLIRPTGDVAGLLERLRGSGVRVAVVTTDHRAETEETLYFMGIADLVDHTVCGNDDLPLKPAPDMLLAACRRLGVEPTHAAVVGDTMADLLMAGRAGAGLKVAVLTGVGEPALLREHADVVLRSVDEMVVEVPA